jgi:hypothetical protein
MARTLKNERLRTSAGITGLFGRNAGVFATEDARRVTHRAHPAEVPVYAVLRQGGAAVRCPPAYSSGGRREFASLAAALLVALRSEASLQTPQVS